MDKPIPKLLDAVAAADAALDMNYFDEISSSSHYLYVIAVVDTLAEIEHWVDAAEEIADDLADDVAD